MPSFENKKELRFVITLGTGQFGSSNNNQVKLQGYRALVDIDKAGGMMMGTLKARIYGVSQDDMNSVTTLQWKPQTWIKNTIEVYAIDGDSETLVFAGNIVNAWGDYQAMPDVYLNIVAQAAYYGQLNPAKAISIKGGIQVATVMKRIADGLGVSFENSNVTTTITDAYLANTLTEQARELARAANIDLYIDDKTLAITNRNSPREGTMPLISPQSGLIGYPTFDGTGVIFRSLFNPGITFGGKVKLETDLKQAKGEWIVTSVAHRLESERPGGAWFSTVKGNEIGLAITR